MRRLEARHLLPIIALLAACGGKSCQCLAPIPGGFPIDARRHENEVQVRVSAGGIDYLAANATTLVGALLPGGTTQYPVPACPGMLCCGDKNAMCDLDIAVDGLGLQTTPPKALSLNARVKIVSKGDVQVSFTVIGLTTHCHLSLDTTLGKQHQDIGFTGDLNFDVDGTTKLTSLSLQNTKIVDLEPAMLKLSAVGFLDQGCNLGNIGFIQNILVGQIGTQVASQVDSAFCASCMTKADCDGWADDCKGGQCMRAGKCVQEIGASGRIDIAGLSALFAATKAKLDLLAVLGSYAAARPLPTGGLSLGMVGGGMSGAHNNCVPVRPPPTVAAIPQWAESDGMLGGVEPVSMKPYHIGIGVHESYLNTLAWGAFDAGTLCLQIGTATVAQLDSKTFGLLLPSLQDLVHSGDAPMFLAVRPSQEPHITLGAGTFDVDPMTMKKTIKDALLHVAIPQLSIDFYAFIDERFVRVMTLTADVVLPVALDVDDKGQIVPMIGDLNSAFTNVTVSNSELLSEKPAALAKTFPMLLGLAGGALGNIAPIALPAIMGLNLKLVAIEPTDSMSTMAIFANLAPAPDAFHAVTEASVVEVLAPPTVAFDSTTGLDPTWQPRVALALGGRGYGGDARDLEWQWQLDDGTWSVWSAEQKPMASDPRLWLQGRHHLAVRARVVGEPATADPEPKRLDFLVDTVAPTGTAEIAGDELTMAASDRVSAADKLEYSFKAPGGEWSSWSGDAHARIPARLTALGGWMARAKDETGNVGELDFHGRTTAPAAAGGGCGCEIGARRSSGSPLAILLGLVAAALLFARKRLLQGTTPVVRRSNARRHAAPLALVVAACAAHLGCNSDTPATGLGQGDLFDPADEVGRYSDAVASMGTIYVTAYDDTFGDLAYTEIKVEDVGKTIAWQWVDGVPVDPAVPAEAGFRHGLTDAGDDVGLYTSLGLTAAGEPRIAYFDATHGALKFAAGTKDRKFHTTVVEQPAAGGGWAGKYASLSLDAQGVPSIAYMLGDAAMGASYHSTLRLATAKNADPTGPSDWSIVDVATAAIPCAGLCAKGQACIQSDKNDKTKSSCMPSASGCNPACAATEACVTVGGQAACGALLAPVKAPDLPEGTGLYARLLRLPSGVRAIVYYDREQGDIKLATEGTAGSAAFTISFVQPHDANSDLGQFATAAVGADGTIHVAYEDSIFDRLLYKTVKAGMAEAMPEVIDDGTRMNMAPRPVGAGAALFVDASSVRVLYQDQLVSDLMGATRDANGKWTPSTLKAGPAGYGFYNRIVSDGGKLYFTSFTYDRGAAAGGMTALGGLVVAALQ